MLSAGLAAAEALTTAWFLQGFLRFSKFCVDSLWGDGNRYHCGVESMVVWRGYVLVLRSWLAACLRMAMLSICHLFFVGGISA